MINGILGSKISQLFRAILLFFVLQISYSCSQSRKQLLKNAVEVFKNNKSDFERLAVLSSNMDYGLQISKRSSGYFVSVSYKDSIETFTIVSDKTYPQKYDKVLDIVQIMSRVDTPLYSGGKSSKNITLTHADLPPLTYNPNLDSLYSGFNGFLSIEELQANFHDKSKEEWAYELADGWYIYKLRHPFF